MSLVHSAHAARSARTAGCSSLLVVFLQLGHERFRGEHQARNGRRVLQRQTSDLGRVDHASLHQVNILASICVEAEVLVLGVADLADHYRAFKAGVVRDLPSWLFQSAANDAHAYELVALSLDLLKSRERAEQRGTAAGNDAFLNGCTGGVHGVLYASLLFLQLGFGCRAHLDDGYAANQLRQAFLELLAVIVRSGVLDLLADLLDAAFDFAGLAGAFHDGGVVFVNGDLLGLAEILDLHVLKLDAEVFGDGLTAGQHSDVFQHSLAAIAKARSLDGSALQGAAQLVHHQG